MRGKHRIMAMTLAVALVFCATYFIATGQDNPSPRAAIGYSPAAIGASYAPRVSQIVAEWNRTRPTFEGNEIFAQAPSAASPYSAGQLKEEFLRDGLNAVNFYRFLADQSPVALDSSYSSRSQHAALLNYMGYASHTLTPSGSRPSRPDGMSNEFWDTAYSGAQRSNLYSGARSLSNAVAVFVEDTGSSNADHLGHRRWVLSPGMSQTGFGQVGSYAAMYTSGYTSGAGPVLFPNEGAFPSEVFKGSTAWSIMMPLPGNVTKDNTSIVLTNSAGKVWSFGGGGADDGYFSISKTTYGGANALIFQPSGVSSYSGSYRVVVSGAVNLDYTVHFFNLAGHVGDSADFIRNGGDNNAANNMTDSGNENGSGNGDGDGDNGWQDWNSGGGSSSSGSGGRGSSGGSGGGGSATRSSASGALHSSSNVLSDGSVNSSALKNEFSAALSQPGDSVALRTKNAQSISPAALRSLASQAQNAGRSVVLHADTMSVSSATEVQARLYVEPDKLLHLTGDLKLGVHTEEQVSAVRSLFEKWFDNKVAVIHCAQQGSFGARMHIAAMVDLTGLNGPNLFFYSYDRATHHFTQIENPDYVVDSKGYLHFFTEQAGDIVITDRPLTPR